MITGTFIRRGPDAEATPENADGIANIGFIIGRDGVLVTESGGSLADGQWLRREIAHARHALIPEAAAASDEAAHARRHLDVARTFDGAVAVQWTDETGRPVRLVDTAGLRRRAKITQDSPARLLDL